MPDTGTPIDKILAILEAIRERLDKIFAILEEIRERLDKLKGNAPPKPEPEPQKPEEVFLARFVRPVPLVPRHGAGVRMSSPDGEELIKRALYSVRWNGDVMSHIAEEAWAEIEALKAGDPKLTAVYAETGIDPVLACVLLLTGYLDTVANDQNSTGVAQEKRRREVGKTPQSWIDEQLAIMRGQPVVSGGDAPE